MTIQLFTTLSFCFQLKGHSSVTEEVEAACIGQEEMGNATLMKEGNNTVVPPVVMAAPPPTASAEEEEAVEMDDPFAMMGGMGQEEMGKVTLMEEKNAGVPVSTTDFSNVSSPTIRFALRCN